MDGRNARMEMFDPSVSSLEGWIERLEINMDRRKVTTDADKVLDLLSLVSPDTYDSLASWTAPKKPRDLKYDELTKLLMDRYCKKKLLINCRHALLSETQKPGQSLEEYYRRLEHLAGKCAFNQVTDVKDCILSMQFIRGLNSDKVRERLLAEEELEGIQTLHLAQKVETMEKSAVNLGKRSDDAYEVHQQKQYFKKGNKASNTGQGQLKCFNCDGVGHLARFCKAPKHNKYVPSGRNYSNQFKRRNDPQEPGLGTISCDFKSPETFVIRPSVYQFQPAIMLPVKLQGFPMKMELDTGAALSIIDYETWKKVGRPTLTPVKYNARSYTGGKIKFKGICTVSIEVGDVRREVQLHVLQQGSPIFGRDLKETIGIGLTDLEALAKKKLSVNELELPYGEGKQTAGSSKKTEKDPDEEVGAMLKKYAVVFSDGLGKCTKLQAKLHMDEEAYHGRKFFRARPVPFALKEQVSENLEDMLKDGIIEQVMHSDWGAPIVVVPKPNGKIRICGDYRVAVNKCLKVDQYPIPKISELFHVLNRGEQYSKLDLEKAYNQVELEEESKKYTTISTHLGLFRYNRLPFGVANAPAIFQNLMDKMLHGIDDVIVYLDDIVVTGRNREEHLRTLEKVFQRLKEHGMKVKAEKCEFFKDTIEVLGHVLSREGIRTNPKKVKALMEMPAPKSLKELESLVGFVNYYARFVPNLADLCRPLNKLRRKDVNFEWGEEQENAFKEIKKRMQGTDVLTHFDPTKPVILATDASEYGLGAVLYHRMEDGTEKVIEYASRGMTTTEQKYAQIEKEALGIVWGMEKFQTYLFGLRFQLRTDHQPLLKIFGPKAELPILAAKRLHRWAIKVAQYTFDIEYVPTAKFGNADGLSRLVDPTEKITDYLVKEEFQLHALREEYFQGVPFNKSVIEKEIAEDSTLTEVRQYLQTKWPEKMHRMDEYLRKLWNVREQLHEQEGIVLKEGRIVIPLGLRKTVLEMLHQGHPGSTRMKELARSKVWYPSIDRDIEYKVKTCVNCQMQANTPQKTVTDLWPEPEKVWQRLHLDFAGPVHGAHWFVLVDAKSKWIQVTRMSRITAQDVIKELEKTFTIFGLPEEIVSDNGTQFASWEYRKFCDKRDIKVTYSPPYHPQSNGAAERAVQTFKRMMAKELGKGGEQIETALRKFLASYRNTPHSTTGKSPAESMFGRPIRTIFDINWKAQQEKKQIKNLLPTTEKTKLARDRMKRNFNQRARAKEFDVGMTVYVRDYKGNQVAWIPGIVIGRTGTVTYKVHTERGDWVRHANQMRKRELMILEEEEIMDSRVPMEESDTQLSSCSSTSLASSSSTHTAVELRKSDRIPKRPTRYSPPPTRRKNPPEAEFYNAFSRGLQRLQKSLPSPRGLHYWSSRLQESLRDYSCCLPAYWIRQPLPDHPTTALLLPYIRSLQPSYIIS